MLRPSAKRERERERENSHELAERETVYVEKCTCTYAWNVCRRVQWATASYRNSQFARAFTFKFPLLTFRIVVLHPTPEPPAPRPKGNTARALWSSRRPDRCSFSVDLLDGGLDRDRCFMAEASIFNKGLTKIQWFWMIMEIRRLIVEWRWWWGLEQILISYRCSFSVDLLDRGLEIRRPCLIVEWWWWGWLSRGE